VVVVIGGLLLFQPWLLFVNTKVDDALPEVSAPSASASATTSESSSPSGSQATGPSASQSASPSSSTSPSPTKPVVLRRGTFVSHEHETTGTALIVQLPDGRRILRLEDLNTSSGPQVEVWLSDQPVIEGRDGWFVFDAIADDVYTSTPECLWRTVLARQGGEIAALSRFPDDPTLN
jgi:hypothetical protein